MRLEVLAEQLITAAAVEALAAELRVVGNHTVTDGEALDFGADGGNNTNGLMAWRKRLETSRAGAQPELEQKRGS